MSMDDLDAFANREEEADQDSSDEYAGVGDSDSSIEQIEFEGRFAAANN